jgi:hypothetical protein
MPSNASGVRIRRLRGQALLASLLVSALPVSAAGQGQAQFVLDLDAKATGDPITLTRPDKGPIEISVVYNGQKSETVRLDSSLFTSDGGSVVANVSDCNRPQAEQPVTIAVDPGSVFRICLTVEALPTQAKYTGRLILSSPNTATFVRAISLVQPAIQQGVLVLDRAVVAKTVTRSTWPRTAASGAQAEFSVTLHDKTGAVPLNGLSVRLEQVSTSPEEGFDLHGNVAFIMEGAKPAAGTGANPPTHATDDTTTDLASPPTTDDAARRSIPAGTQSEVRVALTHLEAGDYSAVLHFTASNATSDDARLQLNVHVRDSVWWALVWLILALIISFVGTKVLTSKSRRAALLQQIRAMQPAWFASLPPSPPVIWTQAVLHQAQRLSKKFWLTSPDLIDARVAGVKNVLAVLDRARQLRERLALAFDQLVLQRAIMTVERVMSLIGAGTLDDATMKSIDENLASLEDWLDIAKFPSLFWENIAPLIQSLQVQIGDAPAPDAARDLVGTLKADIAAALANPPQTSGAVERVYQQYAKLRIIWDQKDDAGPLVNAASDIDEFFKLADDRTWQRVKGAPLKLRPPVATDPDGFEAYDTLQFSVDASDPFIDRSFLFRHKIEYHWTFTLTPTKTPAEKWGWRRAPATVSLTPISQGPSVVQYFPRPGQVQASVKLVYQSDSKELGPVPGPLINASSDFASYKIVAGTEVVSWVIAGLVAIATGLSMFYYKGTSWGSHQDYLTLLLWGIGVDQGKNFLQAMQAFGGSVGSSSSRGH